MHDKRSPLPSRSDQSYDSPMKHGHGKTRSKLKRMAVAMTLIGIFLAFVCLKRIETEPYFTQEYYARSTGSLSRLNADPDLTPTKLLAGAARISITPELHGAPNPLADLPLAGFGARKGAPAVGVMDEVFVRVLWLQDDRQSSVIISLDMLIPPPEMIATFRSMVAPRIGLQPDAIYWSASHTHSGPGGWGQGWLPEAFAGPYEPAFNPWLLERVFACIEQAHSKLQPVSVATMTSHTENMCRNRLVGVKGQTDERIHSLFFKSEDQLIATLGIFSAHATLVGPSSKSYCGDYPGHWAESTEQSTGGIALFLAGGVGSHAATPTVKDHDGAIAYGHQLAAITRQHLDRAVFESKVTLERAETALHLPSPHVRIMGLWRLRPWLAKALIPTVPSVKLKALRVGSMLLLGTPCDFSGELALQLQRSWHQDDLEVVCTSFNGDYIGYVVPQKYYFLNAYETQVMGFYGYQTAPYMTECLRRLGSTLAGRHHTLTAP